MAAALAVISGIALLVGMRLRTRIAADVYRHAIRRLLAVIALVLIAQYLFQRWA